MTRSGRTLDSDVELGPSTLDPISYPPVRKGPLALTFSGWVVGPSEARPCRGEGRGTVARVTYEARDVSQPLLPSMPH